MRSEREKRVMITLLVVGIAFVGNVLMIPGVPAGLQDGARHSLLPPRRLSVLSLGILPYLSASVLWLLLSGMADRLRRRREGTAVERAAFDHAIVWLALVIAWVQGLVHGVYIRNLTLASGLEGLAPPALLVGATTSAGTAVLIWMALFVTRAGVGNGVALIALTTSYLAALPGGVSRELASLRESDVGDFGLPIAVTVLAGLVMLCGFYLRSRRDVALVPLEGQGARVAPPAPPIPLRLNLTGIAPVALASALLALPAAIAGMFSSPPQWLVLTPVVHWTLFVVLAVVLSYVFVGIGFGTRRVGAMLERYGYRIDGIQGESTEEYLDRVIERRILLSSAILIGIVLLPGPVLEATTGISLSRAGLSGEFVLVASAILLDTMRNVEGWRLSGRGSSDDEDAAGASDDGESAEADPTAPRSPERWVVVFESDVAFEVRLALAALDARGVRGIEMSNRVIPLTGTFSFWEWTAPTYPMLVIHRRLGGGRASLRVPESHVVRAREVLAELAA